MKKRLLGSIVVCVLLLISCGGQTLLGNERNPVKRFLEGDPQHSIPLKDIHHGGPPVDGIPALVKPDVVAVKNATKMRKSDQLMVVRVEGQARGYPLRILDRHELVNDQIKDQPYLVTFCPLCGSGVVFNRQVKRETGSIETFEFGVSGLLYQSDVLLYDRATDTLWSQLRAEAVVGPLTGTPLKRISHTRMSWDSFQRKYPNGEVLSFRTGYNRSYDRRAYQRYRSNNRLMFPVNNEDRRLRKKADVIGVDNDEVTVAIPRDFLRQKKVVQFFDDNEGIVFLYHGGAPLAYALPDKQGFQFKNQRLVDRDGNEWTVTDEELTAPDGTSFPRVSHTESFWFAWATFYPDTELLNE